MAHTTDQIGRRALAVVGLVVIGLVSVVTGCSDDNDDADGDGGASNTSPPASDATEPGDSVPSSETTTSGDVDEAGDEPDESAAWTFVTVGEVVGPEVYAASVKAWALAADVDGVLAPVIDCIDFEQVAEEVPVSPERYGPMEWTEAAQLVQVLAEDCGVSVGLFAHEDGIEFRAD
jgi:hypothetical protein